MSEQQKRTFIAIKLPEAVCDSLERTGGLLKVDLPGKAVRWVEPDNIHLTLKFLGDTPVSKLLAISEELDRIVTEHHTPFVLRLDKLGCFPNPRQPRVIWVGLSGDIDRLRDLYRGIEAGMQPLGWPAERRPFHPHLTLGRVNDSRAVVQSRLPWGTNLNEGEISVNSIHLIESQLKPTGAEYSLLHSSTMST